MRDLKCGNVFSTTHGTYPYPAAGSRFPGTANISIVRDLAYLTRLHREPSPLLLECEQQAAYDDVPTVDRATGRLLSVLVHAMQANRVLEIGTSYGSSTLWMALSLPPAGKIWTVDPNVERTQIAQTYFERAGKSEAIEIINQPALEILPTFWYRNLDIVFVRADPLESAEYLNLCVPMLKRSGLFVIEGLLRRGEASADPSGIDTPELTAVRDFSKTFLAHPQLDATIVPIGDGIGIGARID